MQSEALSPASLHHADTAVDDPEMAQPTKSGAERSRFVQYLRDAVTDEHDGPLPAMLLSLTVLVGIVDATSILLAHVFVATITGNIVFLGLAIAGAPGFSVRSSLLPIVAFAVDGGFTGDIWPLMTVYITVADGLSFGACLGWVVGVTAVVPTSVPKALAWKYP